MPGGRRATKISPLTGLLLTHAHLVVNQCLTPYVSSPGIPSFWAGLVVIALVLVVIIVAGVGADGVEYQTAHLDLALLQQIQGGLGNAPGSKPGPDDPDEA